MSSGLRGAILALAAFGVYSTHDVVVKLLGASYSSFQIVFFTGLFGFPLITMMLMRDRTDGTLIPRHPWWSAVRAVAAVGSSVFAFIAFTRLPMPQTYAILFATPLLITVLAIPVLGERVGLRRGLAVGLGLLGVLVVLRPGGGEALSLGHAAALASAVCGATTSIIVRRIGSRERTVVLILYPMMLQVLGMGLLMPFFYTPMPVADMGRMAVVALLSILAGMLVIAAYRAAPAAVVAPMQYSQMIWAVFYGWLFFGEGIDRWTAVGTAVIVASGLYIVQREGQPEVSDNQPVLATRSRLDTGQVLRGLWPRRSDRRP
ncbi:DMT family transporter [Pseudogemmobacter sonorensis]|uniref:DMT family transporter n=1 Tax=Pseudogemmobacter sonorensis TaxID=2989681 RepID=UPI00367C5368